jgi:hypothetical protein
MKGRAFIIFLDRPHTDAKALGRFSPRVNAINFFVVHRILQMRSQPQLAQQFKFGSVWWEMDDRLGAQPPIRLGAGHFAARRAPQLRKSPRIYTTFRQRQDTRGHYAPI